MYRFGFNSIQLLDLSSNQFEYNLVNCVNGDFLEDLDTNSARHTLSETLNTRKSAGGFLS